ncbi:hypothetical protein DRQ36_10445 [bacterium]|nr:MAG: hypothetical protein DRQ36_10445 [bacterium]
MVAKKRYRKDSGQEPKLPFGGKNYALFAIGVLLILLGFVLLSTGDISIAPILLVLGYCVFLPVGVLLKQKPKIQKTEASGE